MSSESSSRPPQRPPPKPLRGKQAYGIDLSRRAVHPRLVDNLGTLKMFCLMKIRHSTYTFCSRGRSRFCSILRAGASVLCLFRPCTILRVQIFDNVSFIIPRCFSSRMNGEHLATLYVHYFWRYFWGSLISQELLFSMEFHLDKPFNLNPPASPVFTNTDL